MYLGNDFEEHAREMETKLWGLWVHKQSDIHHSCESWLNGVTNNTIKNVHSAIILTGVDANFSLFLADCTYKVPLMHCNDLQHKLTNG